jgi:hypothetical protein
MGVRPIADAGLPIVEIGYGLGFIPVARVQFRYRVAPSQILNAGPNFAFYLALLQKHALSQARVSKCDPSMLQP